MATRRWLPLVLASVVTAALAGTVALRALLGGSDADDPHVQGLTPAPTATTSIAGTSTAEPPLTQVDPVLEKRVFAAGEQVTVRSGIGFLSAETGALETWSALPGGPVDTLLYESPDGLLIFGWAKAEPHQSFITERQTGRTWRLRAGLGPVDWGSHGLGMAVQIVLADGYSAGWLDLATGTLSEMGISVQRGESLQMQLSPDGRRLAVLHGNRLSLIQVPPLSSALVADGLKQQTQLSVLAGGLGFALEEPMSVTRRWFSWDGVELQRDLPADAGVSPNGRYVATYQSAGRFEGVGMGGTPTVGSITVVERDTGRTVVQYLGADPLSDFAHAWTAASDAVVVQVAEGYLLVPLNAPAGPANPQWLIRDDIHVLEPRPSPTIAGLLGTNRGTIINTAGRQTIAPLYAEEPWRARWTTRPGELAVELASPGKGRGWPLSLLPMEVRRGTPAALDRLVVEGNACAGLFDGTDSAARELRCLAPGSLVTLEPYDIPVEKPEPGGPRARSYIGRHDAAGGAWLHVRTDGGERGWLRAATVSWPR